MLAWEDPLHRAARCGDVSALKLLFKPSECLPINVNKRNSEGYTALMIAAEKGHLAMVEALLLQRASADSVNKNYETALMLSLRQSFKPPLTNLLARTTHAIDQQDSMNGFTALHLCAKFGYFSTCRVLLEAKGNVDAPDWRGWTPLFHAVKIGSVQIISALLHAKANLNHLSIVEETPLLVAIKEQKNCAVELLVSTGVSGLQPLLAGRSTALEDLRLRLSIGKGLKSFRRNCIVAFLLGGQSSRSSVQQFLRSGLFERHTLSLVLEFLSPVCDDTGLPLVHDEAFESPSPPAPLPCSSASVSLPTTNSFQNAPSAFSPTNVFASAPTQSTTSLAHLKLRTKRKSRQS